MVRLPRPLIGLLTALLLLQWGTAFAHCLHLSTPTHLLHTEICTPEGYREAVLPAAEHEGDPAKAAAAAFCPVCKGPTAAALPAPPEPVPAPPAVYHVQQADPPPAPPPPRPPPRSCSPRAPPTS